MTSQTSTPNSVTPLPGGVNSALQYGFNRATGNFLTNPVFDLTYNKAQQVQYNGNTYSIPDGVSYNPDTSSVEKSATCLLQSEQDFNSYYSKSLQLSGSVPTEFGIVSASAGTSLTVSTSNFDFTSNSYAINTAAQICCQVSRAVGSVNLDKTFTSALQRLPTAITSQNDQAQYEQFFGLYGTHYLVSGPMGASFIMATTIDQSVVQKLGAQTVSSDIGLGFQSLEGGASLSASTVTSSSTFFSTYSEYISCQIYTFGGSGGSTTVDIFLDSAFAYPALLINPEVSAPTVMSLLSDFYPSIATAFNEALYNYMLKHGIAMIGSAQTVAADATEQAGTDSIVLGCVANTGNGDRGYLQLFSDSGQDPGTLRAAASMHVFIALPSDAETIQTASLTTPVRANDYYKPLFVQTALAPSCSISVQSLQLPPGYSFGAWTNVTVNSTQPIMAETDGFLVATIQYAASGDRGYIFGQTGSDSQMTTVIGSSIHYWVSGGDVYIPYESFCLPVQKGGSYNVALTNTFGNATATAYWLPINGNSALLGTTETQAIGQTYCAATDGFLVGFLQAPSQSSSSGYLEVCVGESAESLSQAATIMVENATGLLNNPIIPYNSVTVPISKGTYYSATPIEQPAATAQLYWIPLTNPSLPSS